MMIAKNGNEGVMYPGNFVLEMEKNETIVSPIINMKKPV
jgi:hypothetical protein